MQSIFEIIDEKFDLKSEVLEVKNIFEKVDLIEDKSSFEFNLNTNYNISLEDYIDKYNFRNNEELIEIYDEVFNNCLMLVLLEDYDDFEAKTKKYKEVI